MNYIDEIVFRMFKTLTDEQKYDLLEKLTLENKELKKQLTLTDVGCSLPSKEAMYFKELEEYKVEKLWDDRINRRDFAKGFISCYKWITNQEFKVR